MKSNPYIKMKQNSVMTASPGELTLMLYEGAIKFANQAKVAIEEKDVQRAHDRIIRVQDIIEEFQITLNKEYEVAKSFEERYDYVMELLIEANFKKNVETLDEILMHLRDFRDTWKEVMRLAKQTPVKEAL